MRAEFRSAPQQEIIEKTAFYRQLAILSDWKIDNNFVTINGDELDGGEFGMRQIQNVLRESEALQYWPARWIQAIATHFFSRKPLPLENNRAQTSQSTKCRTARSGRAAAHDRHVKNFHCTSNGDQHFPSHSRITSIARMSTPPKCLMSLGAPVGVSFKITRVRSALTTER